MTQSEQIEKLITANGGMIQTSQITDVGISKTALYQYVKANDMEQISVIIPCQTSYLPVKGLNLLLSTISKVKRQLNRDLEVEGVLLTMVDLRNNYTKDMIFEIHDMYGNKSAVGTFGTYIPRSVRAEETTAQGVSIFKSRPEYKIAEA